MEEKVKSPEELQRLMSITQSEYSIAIRKMSDIEKRKMEAEAKACIILTAKATNLITNKDLKKHLIECFKDDKFKPTVSFIESCTYLEHQPLMEEYNFYSKQAKQLEKEFEMLSSQLIYYQSKNKFKAAELMNKM
jgi:hypothetical protein